MEAGGEDPAREGSFLVRAETFPQISKKQFRFFVVLCIMIDTGVLFHENIPRGLAARRAIWTYGKRRSQDERETETDQQQ
ncbi:MAG: hypothetical protein LBQ15_08590 [Clostridium sp.]|jgi:hypothetical protein|nr:hypothetical protein [Clostridium sp.]